MTVKTLVGRLVAAAMLASVLAATLVKPAPVAADVRASFFQFNSESLFLTGGDSLAQKELKRQAVINSVSFYVLYDASVAASMNEVCPTQMWHIAGVLADNGFENLIYATKFDRQPNAATDGSLCEMSYIGYWGWRATYGNFLAMRYSPLGSPTSVQLGPTRNNGSGQYATHDRTVLVCAQSAVFLLTYSACGNHKGGPDSELLDHYNIVKLGNARYQVMIGDLNRPPNNFPSQVITGMRDADPRWPGGKDPTMDNGDPKDYILLNRAFSFAPDIAIDMTTHSDHHYVRGWFTLS